MSEREKKNISYQLIDFPKRLQPKQNYNNVKGVNWNYIGADYNWKYIPKQD